MATLQHLLSLAILLCAVSARSERYISTKLYEKHEKPAIGPGESLITPAMRRFFDADLTQLNFKELWNLAHELDQNAKFASASSQKWSHSVGKNQTAAKRASKPYKDKADEVRKHLESRPIYLIAKEWNQNLKKEIIDDRIKSSGYSQDELFDLWGYISRKHEFKRLSEILEDHVFPPPLLGLKHRLEEERETAKRARFSEISDELSLIDKLDHAAISQIWKTYREDEELASTRTKLSTFLNDHGALGPTASDWLNKARKDFVALNIVDLRGKPMTLSEKKKERPWLFGDYRYFEPVVERTKDGQLQLTLTPTMELKGLQLRQALWFGTVKTTGMEVNSPTQVSSFTLPDSGSRLQMYRVLQDLEPNRLMFTRSDGGLKPAIGLPEVVAAGLATLLTANPAGLTLTAVLAITTRSMAISVTGSVATQPLYDEMYKSGPRVEIPKLSLDSYSGLAIRFPIDSMDSASPSESVSQGDRKLPAKAK